jgi:hypothetical protein
MGKWTVWMICAALAAECVAASAVAANSGVKVADAVADQSASVKAGRGAKDGIDASDVLTAAIAGQILGDAAAKADLPAGRVSTKDVSVSSCVYTARIDPQGARGIRNTKGVSVLVRAAKTSAGADSNKSQFSVNKPVGVQDVDGLGDKAFFNPQYGQLNILKGGNWYIVSSYSGSVGRGTVESCRQLADLLALK